MVKHYEPSWSEIKKTKASMTEEQKEMTERREKERGFFARTSMMPAEREGGYVTAVLTEYQVAGKQIVSKEDKPVPLVSGISEKNLDFDCGSRNNLSRKVADVILNEADGNVVDNVVSAINMIDSPINNSALIRIVLSQKPDLTEEFGKRIGWERTLDALGWWIGESGNTLVSAYNESVSYNIRRDETGKWVMNQYEETPGLLESKRLGRALPKSLTAELLDQIFKK